MNNSIIKHKLIFKKEKSIILTVGHCITYKNPSVWLEVAKQVLKNPKAIFIWLGEGEERSVFQKIVKE